jgi:hypothetical protein
MGSTRWRAAARLPAALRTALGQLLTLHAAARGTSARRSAAKVVFAPDGTVTPFNIGVILAGYL